MVDGDMVFSMGCELQEERYHQLLVLLSVRRDIPTQNIPLGKTLIYCIDELAAFLAMLYSRVCLRLYISIASSDSCLGTSRFDYEPAWRLSKAHFFNNMPAEKSFHPQTKTNHTKHMPVYCWKMSPVSPNATRLYTEIPNTAAPLAVNVKPLCKPLGLGPATCLAFAGMDTNHSDRQIRYLGFYILLKHILYTTARCSPLSNGFIPHTSRPYDIYNIRGRW